MAILDLLTKLADGLAVDENDAYTTYSYDLGSATPPEVGEGTPLCLLVCVGVAATSNTDTYDISAVSSTAEGLATSTINLAKRRIAASLLTVGSRHVIPIPPDSVTQRYIGGLIECGASDSITVDVDLVPMDFNGISKVYPDAIDWT